MAKILLILLMSVCTIQAGFGQSMANLGIGKPLKGTLTTDFGVGVQDVAIVLKDEAGVELPISVKSSVTGHFQLIELNELTSFSIHPKRIGGFKNGLNVIDLHFLSAAIQYQQFDSPYQKLAGDINDDQKLNQKDIEAFQAFLLGKNTMLENKNSWRFFDASCAPPMSQPFGKCENSVLIKEVVAPINFVAVKVGDMDNTAAPNANQSKTVFTSGSLVLNLEDKFLLAGNTYDIKIKIGQSNILACQFSLDCNGADLIDINTSGFCLKENYFVQSHQVVFCVPNSNSGHFTISIRPEIDVLLSDVLSIDERKITPIAFDEDENIRKVKLAFNGDKIDRFRLFENGISIVDGYTDFRFFTPEATTAKLTIYNTNGQPIKLLNNFYKKGMNRIKVKGEVFKTPGVYSYKLETEKYTAIKKIVILGVQRILTQHSLQGTAGYKTLHSLLKPNALADKLIPEKVANLAQKAPRHQE